MLIKDIYWGNKLGPTWLKARVPDSEQHYFTDAIAAAIILLDFNEREAQNKTKVFGNLKVALHIIESPTCNCDDCIGLYISNKSDPKTTYLICIIEYDSCVVLEYHHGPWEEELLALAIDKNPGVYKTFRPID